MTVKKLRKQLEGVDETLEVFVEVLDNLQPTKDADEFFIDEDNMVIGSGIEPEDEEESEETLAFVIKVT